MRILGFQKKWDKLSQNTFTTFRFPRRDKDWGHNEEVQVVYKPRHKDREVLGIAQIISKEYRSPDAEFLVQGFPSISDEEARADGFEDYEDMHDWLLATYGSGNSLMYEPMSKLTLKWVRRLTNVHNS